MRTRNSALDTHQDSHGAECEFNCEFCSFLHAQLYWLEKHKNKHHNSVKTRDLESSSSVNDSSMNRTQSVPNEKGQVFDKEPDYDSYSNFDSNPNLVLNSQPNFQPNSNQESSPSFYPSKKTKRSYDLSPAACRERYKNARNQYGLCDYGHGSSVVLENHLKNHGSNREYTCDLCDYLVSALQHINRHTTLHHILQGSKQESKQESKRESKLTTKTSPKTSPKSGRKHKLKVPDNDDAPWFRD